MRWAEPLANIQVREKAAMDRVVVSDSGAGAATNAVLLVGTGSSTMIVVDLIKNDVHAVEVKT
eukprot:8714420-Pyramimonas_sp.AAC.1